MKLDELNEWCFAGHFRFNAPFRVVGRRGAAFASDGVTLISVTGVSGTHTLSLQFWDTEAEKTLLKWLDSDDVPQDAFWIKIPADVSEVMLTCICQKCFHDPLPETTICERCHGKGEIYCRHCGFTSGCGTCENTGTIEPSTCDSCKGTRTDNYESWDVGGGVLIARRFLRRMGNLWNCRLLVDPEHTEDPLRFEFEGGRGIVMTMRNDEQDGDT